ncbi:MAG TPA: hypothetical protein VME92_01275 [Acetobacteraceae bacterium]|nr:hypothetical protein [Acetobacteraceae bacterium]
MIARIGFAGLLLCGVAQAHPPPNPDPALSPWFESLTVPGTGGSCCAMADCRQADYRIRANHYEALIQGQWIAVPPDRVLHRTDNPTGHAVACYTPNLGILCFVLAPQT